MKAVPLRRRSIFLDTAYEIPTPYTYVGGNPVNLVDPDGRQVCSPEDSSGVVCGMVEQGKELAREGFERVRETTRGVTVAADITIRLNTSSWDPIDGSPTATSESISFGLLHNFNETPRLYVERGSGVSWGTGGVMGDLGLDIFKTRSMDEVLSNDRNSSFYAGYKLIDNAELSYSSQTRNISAPVDDLLGTPTGFALDGVGVGVGVNAYFESSETVWDSAPE